MLNEIFLILDGAHITYRKLAQNKKIIENKDLI